MSTPTARPRIYWQRDLPFDVTTIRPKGVIGRQYRKLMVFDASPAAHAERVEQVAKAILKHDYPWLGDSWLKTIWDSNKESYRAHATAALAALSKDL